MPTTLHRPTKAGEAAVRKAIKTLGAAADALSEMMVHFPYDRPDDGRKVLQRQNRELADYLDQATWWRTTK